MVYYLCDDEILPSNAGPLRIAVAGSEGLLTEGHFWVKFVSKIEVTPSVEDWTVTVSGTTDLYMDRQAFTADYNHFGITWTDDSNDVWKGTALWRWVSWCNYNGGVSNASLDAGYQVEIVAGDGYSAIFDDSDVKDNDGIIVAMTINDEVLPDPYWPLAIVGEGLSGSQKIKNIVQIKILLDEDGGTGNDWTLLVKGSTEMNMSQSVFEAQATAVGASWTDDDNDEWTGTPLCNIVDWATTNGVISSDALVNGSVIKVVAGDGYSVALDGADVQGNSEIFVADQVNGEPLTGSSYPLKLTGSGLTKKQSIKGVAQIQIMPLSAEINLTVTAANGTEAVLSAVELAGFDAYTADGGTRSSSGSIKNIGTYTGVNILTLLDEVGGLSSGDSVKIIASDGYEKTISYQEANGEDIATYDSEGNTTDATEPLTMIVAYHLDGAPLLAGDGQPGHLRIAVVGPEGVITSGSTWIKAVVALEIIAAGT
jgi:DMSO/TMAO reductase YedYZ molybdopterin-dependent catalytic subunit